MFLVTTAIGLDHRNLSEKHDQDLLHHSLVGKQLKGKKDKEGSGQLICNLTLVKINYIFVVYYLCCFALVSYMADAYVLCTSFILFGSSNLKMTNSKRVGKSSQIMNIIVMIIFCLLKVMLYWFFCNSRVPTVKFAICMRFQAASRCIYFW